MTTLALQVGAGSDDAREIGDGTVELSDASQISLSAATYWAGMRWTGVTVAQAATISSASLEIYTINSTNDVAGGAGVYGQAADNAATFAASTNNITGRSRTTASATWSGDLGGPGWKSLDVTSIVQEIVNRSGWASGNALALLIDSVSGTDLRWRSYEYDTTLAAKLTINYTTSSGQPTAARARFVPGMRRPHGHQGW